jgi:hypothetical protein
MGPSNALFHNLGNQKVHSSTNFILQVWFRRVGEPTFLIAVLCERPFGTSTRYPKPPYNK